MRLACFVFVACPIFEEFVFQFAAILSLKFLLLRIKLKAALSHCPLEEILSGTELLNRRQQVCSPLVLAGTTRSWLTSLSLLPAPCEAALTLCGVTDGSLSLALRFHPPAHLSPAQSKLSKAKMLKDQTKINIGITRDEWSLL